MMTFEQFQATCQPTADISLFTNDDANTGMPGRVYCEVLFIEGTGGGWHLLIGNHTELSNDLLSLERQLYDWACAEGYCEDSR